MGLPPMSSSTATLAAPMTFREVLQITVMRRVWAAQLVSLLGDFLALFAVISVVTYRMLGTPQQVTGVQIAYMLPLALLGPLSGVFVDRWPLKPTLVGSDLIRAGLVLLLLIATSMWQIYVVLCLLSCVSSFFGPAQSVTIRSHVPPEGLMSANALMQMAMMGTRVVGPAAAGALVAAFGPRICYAIDFASFLGSAALIGSVAIVRATSPGRSPAVESTNSKVHAVLHEMGEGMRFIVHHAAISFVVMAMAAGMFVMGCFGPLIAIYVRDSLHASTKMFGIVSPMIGLGMLLGINGLNTFGKKLSNTLLVYSGLGGIAVGLIILTLLPHVWSTLVGNFMIGIAVAGIIVPAQTLFQQATPPELMGRVGSTFMSIVFAAQITGLVLSGILTQHIGVRQVFALCALMLVVLMAVGKLWMEPKKTIA
jgi:DHA3 family macrolide efflux protein-like MFS transporter